MPRRAELSSAYRAHRPAPHPDAQAGWPHNPPTQPLADRAFTGPDIPVFLQLLQAVRVPANTVWLRNVRDVLEDNTHIDVFRGGFISIHDGTVSLRYGSLVLLCVHDPPDIEYVELHVLLPGDLWYPIRNARTVRCSGWPAIIRPIVAAWAALSAQQRIIRATTEAIEELQTDVHDTELTPADRVVSDAAIAQLARMRTSVLPPETPTVTLEALRVTFSTWVYTFALNNGIPAGRVYDMLYDAVFCRWTTAAHRFSVVMYEREEERTRAELSALYGSDSIGIPYDTVRDSPQGVPIQPAEVTAAGSQALEPLENRQMRNIRLTRRRENV